VLVVIVESSKNAGWSLPTVERVVPGRGSQGPVLCWRFDCRVRSISSAIVGGGIGVSTWVINATVPSDYDRYDPENHVTEIADSLELAGSGIGLLTAVDVCTHNIVSCEEVVVCATVGVRLPVWAYEPHEPLPMVQPASHIGTINLVCYVNERLNDAALVNAIMTVTEAKSQALADRQVGGTGTASDAVAVLCPIETQGDEAIFCGPRSYWGARLAKATYEAVTVGIDRQRQ
jgi:adenosylcobinamide hydrolase